MCHGAKVKECEEERFRVRGSGVRVYLMFEVWALIWALRRFRGILGTPRGKYRVYSTDIKDPEAKGPY